MRLDRILWTVHTSTWVATDRPARYEKEYVCMYLCMKENGTPCERLNFFQVVFKDANLFLL